MENVSNSKISILERASVPKISLCGGLTLMLAWCGYVIYLIVTSFELPDRGEAISVAGVALVMFGLGWALVRIAVYLLAGLHRRITSAG
jgi:hypothetical protein